MLKAIYTSLSGMNAYQNGLNTISNNVSNMNTPGFKLSTPLFRDLVNHYGDAIGTPTSASSNRGGGVTSNQTTLSYAQGTFQDTGNALNAAIDGAGFFIVDQDGQRLYTRAGQFEFNKDGILVETGTGAKVLVSMDSAAAGYFDLNTVRVYPPSATTEVTLAGTLLRATTGATATSYTLSQIQVNDTTGATQTLSAKFTPTSSSAAQATTQVNVSGTLSRAINGTATPYSLSQIQVFDASGAQIQLTAKFTPDDVDSLHWTVDILDSSNAVLGSGDLRFNANGSPVTGSSSISIPVKPSSGSPFDVSFNFGSAGGSSGVTSTAGTPISQLRVADQDGAAAIVSDPLHWSVDILDANNVVQGSGKVSFADNGTPATDGSSFTVTIKPTVGPSFDVAFNIGGPGTYAGVTSVTGTASSQLQVLKQNGVAIGTVTTSSFDDHGRLTIKYSNGQTKTVATLILARFDTPDQIKEVNGAHFAAVGAEKPVLGSALSAGFGNIVGGKLEMSNVDLTKEFTDLIIVQRGFQGSSQIVSVANEMMQQLLSMNGNR